MTFAKNFLILVLIIGILVLILFKTCNFNRGEKLPSHKEDNDSIQIIKREAAKNEKAWQDYTAKLRTDLISLQDRDNLLNKAYSSTSNELQKLKKSSLQRISVVRFGDTSYANCDTLASQFNDYIILSEKEKQDCDNIVDNKSQQIAKLTRLHQIDSIEVHYCNLSLTSVLTKYDLLYGDYQKSTNSKRNLLSVALAGQYYQPTKLAALGGGLQFKFKNDFAVSGLFLIDTKGGKVYQGQLIFPIHLKK